MEKEKEEEKDWRVSVAEVLGLTFLLTVLGAVLVNGILDPSVCTYKLQLAAHPQVSAAGTLKASAPGNATVFGINTIEPTNLTVNYAGYDLELSGKASGQAYCRDLDIVLRQYLDGKLK